MNTGKPLTFGFSNVDQVNPFTNAVQAKLEELASQDPNISLIVRSNDNNTEKAIANSTEFAEAGVDVAMILHIDERAGGNVALPLIQQGIPIISIDIPIQLTYYYGLNNEHVGTEAGAVLVDWIKDNWNSQLDKVMVITEQRTLDFFRQRTSCAVDQIVEQLPLFSANNVLYIDSGHHHEPTQARVLETLNYWNDYDRIAIVCMNDNVAVGALAAVREANRTQQVAMLSHDGTHIALSEFERDDSPLIVSTKLFPDVYAHDLIDLCTCLANHEKTSHKNYTKTIPMTRENYKELMLKQTL